MVPQLLVRSCSFCLVAVASSLTLAINPVHAQTVEPLEQPSSPEPNSVPDTQQLIRREQAPLPLDRVYQTPIEQFEPPFADVPRNHWAYEAVTRVFYGGIVRGYPASPNFSQPNPQ
jgi:hypothetical protein